MVVGLGAGGGRYGDQGSARVRKWKVGEQAQHTGSRNPSTIIKEQDPKDKEGERGPLSITKFH